MKLITFYTPSHEPLVRRLLSSCVGEYRVTAVRGLQMGCGAYRRQGWRASVLQKMKAIREEATEDFLFADADVIFLKPSARQVRKEWRHFDCLFQDDNIYCCGLFAMKNKPACLRLLDRCIADLERDPGNEDEEDQTIINSLLPSSGLRYGKLSRLFANPFTLTGGFWTGDEFDVPADTIAFHANWTVGVENKARMLDMVWENMRPAQEIRAGGSAGRIRRPLRRQESGNRAG